MRWMLKYWREITIAVLVGLIVNQYYNPKIEIKTEVKTEVKIKTVTKTNVVVKEVEKRNADGSVTIERVTTDLSTSGSDSATATASATTTKKDPTPKNGVYLGINPLATTDIQLVYTYSLLGPVDVYGSISNSLGDFSVKGHVGVGLRF